MSCWQLCLAGRAGTRVVAGVAFAKQLAEMWAGGSEQSDSTGAKTAAQQQTSQGKRGEKGEAKREEKG